MSIYTEEINKPEKWDYVITPKKTFFGFDFNEFWRYRDLIILFVKRDFAAQYKQTILGPAWHIIQPVFTTIVFLLLFGKIANISTDGIPAILFYMSGITIWNYFSFCFTNTSNTFVANATIFGKVYFPRLILPVSVVLSNIIKFAIQFGLLLIGMIYYHFNGFPLTIGLPLLLIPVLILIMAGLGLGLGIIISSLTTKYRDMTVLVTFGVQLLMYATPIAYPISYISNPTFKKIIMLNPLSSLVEAFRYALFQQGAINYDYFIYSIIFTLITLVIGVLIFNKVEGSFMDTV